MQKRGYLHQAEARLKWAAVKRNPSLSARLCFQDNYSQYLRVHTGGKSRLPMNKTEMLTMIHTGR